MAYPKPEYIPIRAPRPLKQSVGSPNLPRRYDFSTEAPTIDERQRFSSPSLVDSPRMTMSSSESYDDKPEIRELYLAAEIELKELVEGFTHTFVHNLLKEGSQETTSRQFWEDGEEDSLMMDEEYFSRPFSNEYRHGCALEEVPMFAMEDLPRLGGSPSPVPEREPLSADIRNYGFLDLDDEFYESAGEQLQDYYPEDDMEADYSVDEDEDSEVEEARRLFIESRWVTHTPPLRAANPVTKNQLFGRGVIVVTTTKNVLAPSESEQQQHEWRQRRKRIMSEPPQKPASYTSIECF